MELYNKEELLEYAKACNLSDVADRVLMKWDLTQV